MYDVEAAPDTISVFTVMCQYCQNAAPLSVLIFIVPSHIKLTFIYIKKENYDNLIAVSDAVPSGQFTYF